MCLITACTSEFYKHDSRFKTNQHVAYSWWGYNNTTAAATKMSAKQGWWGKEMPYAPAKQNEEQEDDAVKAACRWLKSRQDDFTPTIEDFLPVHLST